MADLLPDLEDRASAVTLLLLAEVLTRRGEKGPLARVFVPRPRSAHTIQESMHGKTRSADNTGESD